MKAFEVTLPKRFPYLFSAYAGESPSKVRYFIFRQMLDANYRIKFKDFMREIHLIRKPVFDNVAATKNKTESLGWHDREYCHGVYSKEDIK